MKIRADILAALLMVAVGALLSWWLSTVLQVHPVPAPAPDRRAPDYVLENFSATAMDESGGRKYVLSGKRLSHYPDDDTALVVRPYLIRFSADGPPLYTRADTGIVSEGMKKITMKGRVSLTRKGTGGDPAGAVTTDTMVIDLK